MRSLSSIAVLLSSAALLAACSSTKVAENAPVDNGSSTASTTGIGAGAVDPLNDPNNILSKRSVYFDFDSYVINDEYRPLVEAHARYLNSHKDRQVVIEGNTDARGGAEYNLALGQKRADAVRRALNLLGVSDSQVEAVSFGKEKPKAEGNNETAWSQNRRSDIVYK